MLFRDRVKAWRGELLLFGLLIYKKLAWLPTLRKGYQSLIARLIQKARLFDREFYLDRYNDVQGSKISPLRHYVTIGYRQRRAPMAFFDPDYYHLRVPKRAKYINSLIHYAYVGRYRRVSPSPWFDADYYLAINKDVARAGVDPLLHFWKWGGVEGRSPSPEFNSSYYLRTNPVVTRLRINPLLHYLRIGRLEGRSILPDEGRKIRSLEPSSFSRLSTPSKEEWSNARPRTGREAIAVDVIVPVYKGRDETLRCLYSVLTASCKTSFELIVINDASPDEELTIDVERLAGKGLFTLLSNNKNRGFVYTANRGMGLHQDRDVVLLNSDTEVFADWLDRLRQAADRHPNTCSVTPLSNNATICSYPRFLQDNPFPLELDYAELDNLTAKVNAGVEIEAPTGVGFCMYIKRAALAEIGLFDESTFGMGYGEENDFCQRAIARGWRNMIAADVFVPHWGMTSFQGESAARVREALKILDRLHPRYQKDVVAFIDCDPLLEVRQRLDLQRLISLRREKNILIVCHNRGGGAERHVQEDIQKFAEKGYGVYLMRPMPGRPSHAVFSHFEAIQLPNMQACSLMDTAGMCNLLNNFGITELHTHSLVDFIPETPERLLTLVKTLDIRWEVNLHDYKVICPRINLADGSGTYCGEPAVAVCNNCLAVEGSDFSINDIVAWRAMHNSVLEAADQVLVPDLDAAERLERYFPDISFEVSPHESIDLKQIPIRFSKLAPDEMLRVVIIGAIGKVKGFNVLLDCARNARSRKLPIKFILMGYSMNDRLLQDAGVEITGRYLDENAQKTMESLSPHVVWLPSLWPETYSYTLSIALKAGLSVVAFDIGAIAGRIRGSRPVAHHNLFPLEMAKDPDLINDYFVDFRLNHILTN